MSKSPLRPSNLFLTKNACVLIAFICGTFICSNPIIAQTEAAKTSKADSPTAPSFRDLFDGKSLDGWEGDLEWFRVENGAIVAGSLENPIPHNYFLCTEQEFTDFELVFEVKLRGQGNNAGVQFRSSRVAASTEVSGYQCDVGVAWDRPVWGALYDESRRNRMLAEGPAAKITEWLKPDDWNELTVKCIGNEISISLNGNPTIEFREEDAAIASTGIIGLQIHSGPPTEALYRKIRIRELND